MAFKKMTEYNEERYGKFFRLVNDKDCADVVFLYRQTSEVLVANAHYIKSPDYSGYVHCTEYGCPVCEKEIRIQSKLFIPVLVLAHSDPSFSGPRLQFWDRSMRFQAQLMNDVFRNYPNPSEMIFRITRHGVANSVDTYYSIQAVRHIPEDFGSYEQMLANNNITLPDDYSAVCAEYSAAELRAMLNAPKDGVNISGADYGATPRNSYSTASAPQVPAVNSTAQVEAPSFDYVSPGFAISDTGEVAIPAPAPDTLDVDEIEDEENVDF